VKGTPANNRPIIYEIRLIRGDTFPVSIRYNLSRPGGILINAFRFHLCNS